MIYLNEDLPTLRFKLLQFVKKLDNVKAAHTRDGKIHCLLMDNTRVAIENPDDLFKLGVDLDQYLDWAHYILHHYENFPHYRTR
jgi:hypothetical protein